jgi:SagB-type dehydrogenase family enzyme
VELYVLAWGIEGLERGLYHYVADQHALEAIGPGLGPDRVPEYFPQAGYFSEACAVVLFSAVYERDLWRYGYSRAYRAPLVEAGHLCQTFCLLATAHKLAPFQLMGLADSAIERDLRVDGITESVLYAAGIGVLPEDVPWAPAPPGFKVPAARENDPSNAPRAYGDGGE